MAQSATITIDAQTGEARAELQELEEGLESVEVSGVEASRSMEGLGDATSGTQKSLGGLTSSAEAAERGMEDVAGASERAEQGVRSAGQGVDEFSRKAQTMRSSASATASNLGFELVQASQDAKFGLQGVANQLPLMAEQFSQLQQKTGSTTGALSSLAATFTNPATGVIAGVTLLLTFKDDLIGFFSDTEQSAKEAAEEFGGFASTVDSVEQSLNEARETFQEVEQFDFSLRDPGRQGLVPDENREEVRTGDIQRLRNLLSESGTASRLLRSQLLALGVDLQTVTEGSIAEAQEKLEQFQTRINQIIQAPAQAIADRPQGFAVQVGTEFRRIQERQQQLVEQGLRDQEEAIQRQVDFLQSALTQASDALTQDQFGAFFGPLQSRLNELEGQLESNTDEQEKQLSALEKQEQSTEELQQTLEQIRSGEQDALIQQRQKTEELEKQAEAARAARRALFRSTPDATQVEAAGPEDAGTSSIGENIPDRIDGPQADEVEEEADNAASAVEGAEARIISASANMASALVRAFQRGEKSAQQIAATILQGVGGILQAIPGFGNIAGTALGALGSLVGSFANGGVVSSRLQIVGEQGPELAAMPQGSRVVSNAETRRMVDQATRGGGKIEVRVTGDVIRLGPREIGVALREQEKRRSRHQ